MITSAACPENCTFLFLCPYNVHYMAAHTGIRANKKLPCMKMPNSPRYMGTYPAPLHQESLNSLANPRDHAATLGNCSGRLQTDCIRRLGTVPESQDGLHTMLPMSILPSATTQSHIYGKRMTFSTSKCSGWWQARTLSYNLWLGFKNRLRPYTVGGAVHTASIYPTQTVRAS